MTDDRFRLTALDARRWDFGNALRGYDRGRVEEFREQVSEELERLARHTQELETKAGNFLEQLRVFRERDKALNEALVSAQQLRGEIRGQAEREAQLIIREARTEAERIVAGVQGEVRRAEEELVQLMRARKAFIAQMRALIERQATELAAADDDATPSVRTVGAAREEPTPYTPLGAAPPRAALNLTQAFAVPAVPGDAASGGLSGSGVTDDPIETPDAASDAATPPRDGSSFRLTIDTTTPRAPGLGEPLPEPRVRPAMPTPSWLDAVDEDETR